ncbi:MAG TPA: hypothetical protein VL171_06785 [Verrucomicrobiae bacterium]|nr:hypothetical protein [Verrucomicrobiae bacterium]
MLAIIACPKNIILLFDECGTPSFSPNAERCHFLGVCVRYEQADEDAIFAACDKLAALSNKTPRKNNELGHSTSLKLARVLSAQPVAIYARYANLKSHRLRNVVEAYGRAGNVVRMGIRARREAGVRERKIPQTLHSHMLCECLLGSILELIDASEYPLFTVHPFIDDWPIPRCDEDLYLNGRSESMQREANKQLARENKHGFIGVKPVSLLQNTSPPLLLKRKRLVDSVTSTISRSSVFTEQIPGSVNPVTILSSGLGQKVSCVDITEQLARDILEMAPDVLKPE